MKRAALAFALGLILGVLLVLGPGAPTDSPWPAPIPSPRLISIDWDEEARKVAAARCLAEKVQLEIACRVQYTGRPNPPRKAWNR